jgi:hypothetical protein
VSGPENIRLLGEKASQTFKRGDILKMSGSLVQLATATGISANMAGVAAADASGTTSADVPVYMFSAEQVWRAFVNTAVVPTASFTVGVDYKVKQASVGAGEVSATAGTDVVVYSLKAEGQDGTTAGDPILVKIDSSQIGPSIG